MSWIKKLDKLSSGKLIFIICLVGFFVWANVLFNGFVWDDEEEIVNNKIIHNWSNLSQIISGGTFNTGGTGALSGWFFRPARTLTLMINYSIWGPHAFGWHLIQVLFHLVNTILVFKILIRLLEKSSYKNLLAAILSLVFVVHSALSEAIVYIAAASEVMFTFCNLAAFYLLLKVEKTLSTWRRAAGFGLLLFTAMLVKESAIIMVPIIILYLFLFRIKEWQKWLSAMLVVFVGYFILRLVIIQTPIQPLKLSIISEAPLVHRLLTMPYIVFGYLKIIFFPSYLAISQQHVVRSISINQFFLPLMLSGLFFGLFLYASFRFRSKIIFFGLAWFSLGLGPILNIFPLDMTIGERWLYSPFIGLIIAFAGLFASLLAKYPKFLILISCLALMVPILGIRTIIRNLNWHDGLTLYSHDLRLNPDSFDIENNLGVELFRYGKIEEAKPHFERSLKLNPKWHFAMNNLGAVYQREGNYQKAEELYQSVLKQSDYYLAYENLAYLILETSTLEETINFTKEAVAKFPQNSRLRVVLALAYYQNSQFKEAEIEAKEAFFLEPSVANQALIRMIIERKEIKLD